MEWAKKCISDGANVNYQTEVSYDVHVYHIERSIMNEMFFTCADLHTVHVQAFLMFQSHGFIFVVFLIFTDSLCALKL